jgi:glycosyltransferase 2 family protein
VNQKAVRSNAPAPSLWRRIRPVALALFTIVFLGLLVRHLAGTEQFVETLRTARWGGLFYALSAMAFALAVSARRWTIILGALGYRVPIGRAFAAMFATWPLALFAPSRASDVLRAVAIKDLCPPVIGAGAVLVEKAIDVQALCLLTMIGAGVSGLWSMVVISCVLLVGEWVVIGLLMYAGEVLERLPVLRKRPEIVRQLLFALSTLLRQPGRLSVAALASIACWVAATLIVVSLLSVTRAEVAFMSTLALWPPALLVGQLPLTLAGMGTRDMAFIYMLRAGGYSEISESAVLAATFGYALVATWLPALIGLPFTMRFFLGRSAKQESAGVFLEQDTKHDTK